MLRLVGPRLSKACRRTKQLVLYCELLHPKMMGDYLLWARFRPSLDSSVTVYRDGG